MLIDCADARARWRDAPPEAIAGNALRRVRRSPATPARRGAVPEARADAAALLAPGAEPPGATAPRVDPAEALPLYVRDKVAQTTREREAAARRSGADMSAPHGRSEGGAPSRGGTSRWRGWTHERNAAAAGALARRPRPAGR